MRQHHDSNAMTVLSNGLRRSLCEGGGGEGAHPLRAEDCAQCTAAEHLERAVGKRERPCGGGALGAATVPVGLKGGDSSS